MDNAQEKLREREGERGKPELLTVYCFSLASTLSLCPSPSLSLGSVSFRFYAF